MAKADARFLSPAERRTGGELAPGSAVADSKQTLLCTDLFAALLVGLVLSAYLGWWCTDPVAALVLIARRPGKAARHGAASCAVHHLRLPGGDW